MQPLIHLLCPHCREYLQPEQRQYVCLAGHAFDLARDGYLNLLPARGLSSRLSGDSPDMIRARRRFLDRGYYQPLSEATNTMIASAVGTSDVSQSLSILDAGCGEGYFLGRLQSALHTLVGEWQRVEALGMDIAKEAVRPAARRYHDVRFVVADTKGFIPCVDASIDVLLNVFAPRNRVEFARVMAPGGLLVVVIPSPAHLHELRALLPLLAIQNEKRRRVLDEFQGVFTPGAEQTVEYVRELAGNALVDLIGMMPSIRHLSAESLALLRSLERHTVTFSFQILTFRRH